MRIEKLISVMELIDKGKKKKDNRIALKSINGFGQIIKFNFKSHPKLDLKYIYIYNYNNCK